LAQVILARAHVSRMWKHVVSLGNCSDVGEVESA